MKMNIQLFGEDFPPFYGKSLKGKFYAWKKKRAEKRIAKAEKTIKVCDEVLKSLEIKK